MATTADITNRLKFEVTYLNEVRYLAQAGWCYISMASMDRLLGNLNGIIADLSATQPPNPPTGGPAPPTAGPG
jgi:hypothetical protein